MIATVPGPATIEWLTDREEAFAKARRERMPILIDVYHDDCEGCVKLDEVTYVDERVAAGIVERFIPLKLGLFQDRDFTRQHQVFWTPTILIADHSGRVRYTSVNYLPPEEFLDVLDIGEAMAAMRWKRFDESIDLLREIQDRRPDGPMTAEAIYWRGMAAYFRDGKSSGSAKAVWAEIRERFPDSIWAKRQP